GRGGVEGGVARVAAGGAVGVIRVPWRAGAPLVQGGRKCVHAQPPTFSGSTLPERELRGVGTRLRSSSDVLDPSRLVASARTGPTSARLIRPRLVGGCAVRAEGADSAQAVPDVDLGGGPRP